jgi:hypothetical protein
MGLSILGAVGGVVACFYILCLIVFTWNEVAEKIGPVGPRPQAGSRRGGLAMPTNWDELEEVPEDDPMFSRGPSFVFKNAEPPSTPDTSAETPELEPPAPPAP